MLDLPILILKKNSYFNAFCRCRGVIIADKSLSKEERLIIVDQCLEFNYKVYIVPLIADWENQKRYHKK
jgi:hypothetical protein